MNDTELKKVCDAYRKSIVEEDGDRFLMLMAKDIERQTRQECVSMAYDLANNIANMSKG